MNLKTKLENLLEGHSNDKVTRTWAIAIVMEHLRGITTPYKVVCDETNNPPEVIDANQIVVDIIPVL